MISDFYEKLYLFKSKYCTNLAQEITIDINKNKEFLRNFYGGQNMHVFTNYGEIQCDFNKFNTNNISSNIKGFSEPIIPEANRNYKSDFLIYTNQIDLKPVSKQLMTCPCGPECIIPENCLNDFFGVS